MNYARFLRDDYTSPAADAQPERGRAEGDLPA